MIAIVLSAIALFGSLFVRKSIGPLDFWWWISLNLVILITWSAIKSRRYRNVVIEDFRHRIPKKIAIGLVSAVVLYFIFYIGSILSQKFLPLSAEGIAEIYNFKAGVSPARVWILMTVVIGPGEEYFWRGYVQRALAARIGRLPSWILTAAIYAGVHAGSGNPMLLLAALVCGVFWGWLYLRFDSILLNAVSHTVWDVAVFLVRPFV
jgi:membrane protease YdiL (CAAX protease family)